MKTDDEWKELQMAALCKAWDELSDEAKEQHSRLSQEEKEQWTLSKVADLVIEQKLEELMAEGKMEELPRKHLNSERMFRFT